MKLSVLDRRLGIACLVLAAHMAAAGLAAADVTVTIYHTSDLHANTANLPRISQFVRDRRKADPNVLFVDSGDWFNKGEMPIMYTRGEAMLAVMAACGYDAVVLGNHDFSFGTKRLVGLVDRFSVPLLAANCTWAVDARLKNVRPYRIFQLKGVKVGVIGAASEHANHASDRLMKLAAVDEAIKDVVPRVRKEADVVVLVTHVGRRRDLQIAQAVDGIDVIMGGHDHAAYRKMVFDDESRTVIQHSGSAGRMLGEVVLRWDGAKITGRRTRIIDIVRKMPEDAKVKALRAKYIDALSPDTPVAGVPKAMTREDLTRWLAGAVREAAKVDVVLISKELAKAPLPAGKVTPRALLKAVPRLDVARFSVAGPREMELLLKRVGKRNKTVTSYGRAPAGGAIRAAYPCVSYDKMLNAGAVGLDKALVSDVQRVEGKSLWHIALEAARRQKTLSVSRPRQPAKRQPVPRN